jgi:hypothetical protein
MDTNVADVEYFGATAASSLEKSRRGRRRSREAIAGQPLQVIFHWIASVVNVYTAVIQAQFEEHPGANIL